MEGYPPNWWHCTIHLNPETGEMHSDGDHRVRQWIEERIEAKRSDSVKEPFGPQDTDVAKAARKGFNS
jgi:hypothetical protein